MVAQRLGYDQTTCLVDVARMAGSYYVAPRNLDDGAARPGSLDRSPVQPCPATRIELPQEVVDQARHIFRGTGPTRSIHVRPSTPWRSRCLTPVSSSRPRTTVARWLPAAPRHSTSTPKPRTRRARSSGDRAWSAPAIAPSAPRTGLPAPMHLSDRADRSAKADAPDACDAPDSVHTANARHARRATDVAESGRHSGAPNDSSAHEHTGAADDACTSHRPRAPRHRRAAHGGRAADDRGAAHRPRGPHNLGTADGRGFARCPMGAHGVGRTRLDLARHFLAGVAVVGDAPCARGPRRGWPRRRGTGRARPRPRGVASRRLSTFAGPAQRETVRRTVRSRPYRPQPGGP